MPQKITLPNVNERQHVHIINPCAGDGRLYAGVLAAVEKTGETVRLTEGPGDVTKICMEEAAKDPFVHLVVYGGDGTVNEAVNGIMRSGRNDTVSFSVIPAGSGNDFSAYVNREAGYTPPDLHHLDVVKAGDRYFANSMNLGFDCQVVRAADRFKHQKGLRGGTAYIAGIASVLVHKKGVPARLVLEGIRDIASGADKPDDSGLGHVWDGGRLTITGEILLCACANGPFCGGGFKGAPLCDMEDGWMDVLAVRDISRTRFVSIVGQYRSGSYITPDGRIDRKFRGILEYYQCKKLTVTADEPYCLDGELMPASGTVSAELIPQALWYAAL